MEKLKIEIPSLPDAEDVALFFQSVHDENITKCPTLKETRRPAMNFVFLRDDHGSLRGAAAITFSYDLVWIDSIWIEPSLRRLGHGRALYEAIEDLAYVQKKRRAILSTFEFQNAVSFWESLGFVRFGEVAGLTEGTGLTYLFKEIRGDNRPRKRSSSSI